jgi:hypothetical protein
MDQVHQLLKLPSSRIKSKRQIHEVNMRVISRRLLAKLIVRSLFSRNFIIINLQLPHGITDRNPDILEIGASLVRENFGDFVFNREKPTCVVHLRSGNRTVKTERFNKLPQLNARYYDLALQKYANPELEIIIHTDFFPEDFLEDIPSFRLAIFKNFLESVGENTNVHIHHYAPIVEVVIDMATADTLIMGNSALSYFAGLINTSTVVWPPIHGHAKLTRWTLGPLLPPEEISFLDDTNHSLKPSLDHTVYRNRLTE